VMVELSACARLDEESVRSTLHNIWVSYCVLKCMLPVL
jgi:hypothetical protein